MKSEGALNLIAEPEPLKMEPERTAVIVVDMQNAFVSEGGFFDLRGYDPAATQMIIEPINRICTAARERGNKVIYIAHVLSPDLREVGPDSSFWYKSMKFYRENPHWKDGFIIRGTWGARIIDALRPREGDLLVEKPRFSAFHGTNLDGLLKTYNLKYLLFAGCATNICVESSIRDAAHLGYFPILISDATANNGPAFMQEATQFNVKVCFGWVAKSEDAVSFLQSRE